MDEAWTKGTWDGARREQLRRSLDISVSERLRALEGLSDTAERVAEAGRRTATAGSGQTEVLLEGSRPTPLASYLSALGVFRLVGEGSDNEARGWWSGSRFVLRTHLDRDELARFLLERYHPTAMLTPWNGGSGFYEGHYRRAVAAVQKAEDATADRFAPLRDTIVSVKKVLRKQGLTSSPDKSQKEELLVRLRAELDDQALQWLDAAILLGDEKLEFPPLLGTGGNDGNLDFSVNFLQSLAELFDFDTGQPTDGSKALLEAALFDAPSPALRRSAVGQFDPSGTGGPNAASSFEASSLVNPWEYVLMLEGAVLFAAAATRRLGSTGPGALSYPFTVRATGAGHGSTHPSDEKEARGEMWMPLWQQPVSLGELRGLLGEGRATVGHRAARDGLDFARAVACLGVTRGVDAFQRYALLQRYGRTFLATPLDRISVQADPRAELIDQLERRFDWLSRFRGLVRRDGAPARLTSLGRQLDNALFRMTTGNERSPTGPQEALVVLGQIMRYLANSSAARVRCPPVPLLGADWVAAANDGSAEFRVAAALAGLHAAPSAGRGWVQSYPMVEHLAPVSSDSRWKWSDQSHHDVVWGHRALDANLRRVLERRLLRASKRKHRPARSSDNTLTADPVAAGDGLPLFGRLKLRLNDVSDFLEDELDSHRIELLFLGLVLTRIPRRLPGVASPGAAARVPAAYRLLKPLFTPHRTLVRIGFLHAEDRLPLTRVPLVRELGRRLGSDAVGDAVHEAVRRLRAAGFPLPPHAVPEPSSRLSWVDGPRLLAALLVPLHDLDLRHTLRPFGRRSRGTGQLTTDTHHPEE